MFNAIVIALVVWAFCQDSKAETYVVNGKQATKLEAVRALIASDKNNVMRCAALELTKDAKVKVKRDKK